MVSAGRKRRPDFYFLLVGFITVAFVMAPLTAGVVAWLCSKLIGAGIPGHRAAGAALLTGLGTPLLFRAGYLKHNLLVADAGFGALLLLWDPKDYPIRSARAFCAGLLAGYSLFCDYSGAVVIVTAGAYVWLRSRDRRQRLRGLVIFAGGVIPGTVALLACQGWAFGSIFLPSQQYMPPTASTSQGYCGFSWPSPALVWALFCRSPVRVVCILSGPDSGTLRTVCKRALGIGFRAARRGCCWDTSASLLLSARRTDTRGFSH